MDTAPKKNTKWIIFGSVIFILAILIAVCPILITKYMRAKWENTPTYKTTSMLMNISGELKLSNDNTYYIKGDNNLFYVLENVKQNLENKVNEKCSVVCKFRQPKNNETIDGNPVRLFIDVQKFVFANSEDVTDNNNEENINENSKENVDLKQKTASRAKLRVEANTRLNKPIFFDVIKGKVSSVNRKDRSNKDYTAFVVTDEFNDNYMLYKKGKDLSSLNGKEIIVLGREILPPSNMYLVVDETTFEIYEVYDEQYNKLM